MQVEIIYQPEHPEIIQIELLADNARERQICRELFEADLEITRRISIEPNEEGSDGVRIYFHQRDGRFNLIPP